MGAILNSIGAAVFVALGVWYWKGFNAGMIAFGVVLGVIVLLFIIGLASGGRQFWDGLRNRAQQWNQQRQQAAQDRAQRRQGREPGFFSRNAGGGWAWFLGIILIGAMALFAYLFLFSKAGAKPSMLWSLLLVTLAAVFSPSLRRIILWYAGLIVLVIVMGGFKFPALIIIAVTLLYLVVIGTRPNWGGWGIAATILIIHILMIVIAYPVFNVWVDPDSPLGVAVESQRDLFDLKVPDIPNIAVDVKSQFERQLAFAVEDTQAGQVDEDSTKDLGVFLENIGHTGDVIKPEPINVFATLKAELSDLDDEIKVKLNCYAERGGKREGKGTMRPSSIFTFEKRGLEDVDCIIDTTRLDPGAWNIVIEATFDFTTSSYVSAYLMDKDRLRALTRQNIDPIEFYDLEDDHPIARYTPGPLAVMPGFAQSPIGISDNLIEGADPIMGMDNIPIAYGPTLKLTLDNEWSGEMKSVENIVLTIPEGMRILDVNGGPITCEDTCGKNVECVCTLDKKRLELLITKNDYNMGLKNFRFSTAIEDVQKVLKDSPLMIRNFKAVANYTYKIEDTTGVRIDAPPDRFNEDNVIRDTVLDKAKDLDEWLENRSDDS